MSGARDPDPDVLTADAPLVFYGLDRPGRLQLVKTGGQVRVLD